LAHQAEVKETPTGLQIHNIVGGGFCECRNLAIVLSWAVVVLRYVAFVGANKNICCRNYRDYVKNDGRP